MAATPSGRNLGESVTAATPALSARASTGFGNETETERHRPRPCRVIPPHQERRSELGKIHAARFGCDGLRARLATRPKMSQQNFEKQHAYAAAARARRRTSKFIGELVGRPAARRPVPFRTSLGETHMPPAIDTVTATVTPPPLEFSRRRLAGDSLIVARQLRECDC